MVNNKKCAAVVLNYNDFENAIKFVNMIRNYSVIDQIIVVDNASTDNSYEELKRLSDSKIFVCETGKNGGYGFGNNYGIRIAKERFDCVIAFICNSDIIVSEECMEAIANTILESDNVVIASAIQRNGFTGNVIKGTSWDVPKTLDYIRNSLVIFNSIVPVKTYNYKYRIEEVGCVPGAFLAVDISKFLFFGGYDEGIFLFCEESVIGARAKDCGFKTILLTDYYYEHYHSISINKSIPNEINKFKLTLRSRKYYLRKYRNLNKVQMAGINLVFGFSILEWKAKLFLQKVVHK